MTAPIWAESPKPLANAGTEGAAKKLAVRFRSRIDRSLSRSWSRSVAEKTSPPLLSAMHWSAG